ncbi:cupredoxin domain-containing protein [Amycolatopsis sp. NPDC054798]
MKRFFALLAASVLLTLAAPQAPSAAAATQTVMMQDYAYSPASLTVHVGDTVTWIQHDTAPHDVVTTSSPVSFRSPQLSQGQSWSYTFRAAGTYSYYCSVHPDMRAQVIVQPAAPTQPPPTRASAPAPVPRPVTTPSRTAVAVPVAPTQSAVTSTVPSQPSAAAAAPAPTTAATVAQAATTSLNPQLLVAGLVTAVAIGCLLLLTSRKA